MRSKSRHLIEKDLCNPFAKRCCLGADVMMNFFTSFVESVTTTTIMCRILRETTKQIFYRCAHKGIFMKVLFTKICSKQENITHVAAFVVQRMIIAVKEQLRREPQKAWKVPSTPTCSLLASTGAKLKKECKAKGSRRK